jgi:general secretion pathway protein C
MSVRGGDKRIATRTALTTRPARLLRQLPRLTVFSAVELALLVLIAIQCARLVWLLVAPLGPVGDWRPARASGGDTGTLASFDPFFRLSAAPGPVVVTALNLKLYGVREDRATGRGSAIIALPDGRQASFAVGDELIPGVTLSAVAFDNVTISRGGVAEQIFLDQSLPAQNVGAVPAAPAPIVVPGPPVAAVPAPVAGGPPIGLVPRLANGRVNGIAVSPGGDGGQAFRSAGFIAGDVIVAVDGQRVTSLEQARAAIGRAGGEVTVMVDRGGRAVPMRVRLNP